MKTKARNPVNQYIMKKIILLTVIITLFYPFFLSSCKKYTDSVSGPGYYYANWNCKGQSQCIAVMGYSYETTGPFCSASDCQAWKNKFIPGSCTCDLTPTYKPVIGGNPPNGKCFVTGNF
jgi:hypothetical protein